MWHLNCTYPLNLAPLASFPQQIRFHPKQFMVNLLIFFQAGVFKNVSMNIPAIPKSLIILMWNKIRKHISMLNNHWLNGLRDAIGYLIVPKIMLVSTDLFLQIFLDPQKSHMNPNLVLHNFAYHLKNMQILGKLPMLPIKSSQF